MKTHTTTTSIRRGILAASILGFTAIASHAATVTWGAAQGITDDSDVSTAGTLVGAFNNGATGVAGTTVNGVAFTAFALPVGGTTSTSGNFHFTATGGTFAGNNSVGSASAPFSNLSAGYQGLLSSVSGTAAGPITFTLAMSGLTTGQTYQFEWWSNVSNGNGNNNLTTATATNSVALNAGNANGSLGQFATGTFVADATNTQSITFTGGPTGPTINGFQLRNLSAVPEPGSALAGMLALGVCLSGVVKRSRRQTVGA